MLVVAGTLVFVVTQSDELATEAAGTPLSQKAGFRKGGERTSNRTSPLTDADTGDGHPGPDGDAGEIGARRSSTAAALRKNFRVEVDAANPRRHEIEQRAILVENDSLRRLGILTEQLDLTAGQQARIFPVLVRGSQSYDPTMRIVSGSHARPTPAGEEAPVTPPLDKSQEKELVQKELDPEQSDELIERSIGDLLIWEEIIGGLTRQLDQAVPGEVVEPAPERGMTGLPGQQQPVEEAPAGSQDPATPPESLGGRNIFDP